MESLKWILISIGVFLIPYILYYGIHNIVLEIRSKSLFKDAQEYGVYNSIWACRKKYYVTKGLFDEYIIEAEDKSESFVMSKLHLWNCLKKKRGIPDWPIAYPNSSPAQIVINHNNQ